MFLEGLKALSKLMLDALAAGKISLKIPREAIQIIENMIVNATTIKEKFNTSTTNGKGTTKTTTIKDTNLIQA